jgi:hypothetical protein
MTLDEAQQVLKSLKELSPDVEEFSWGPSREFAQQRQREAIRIIRREIRSLRLDTKAP